MESKKETACKKAIINTLAYRSVFKYSLDIYQLRTMLISNEEISDDDLSEELSRLQKKGAVKSRNNRYYSTGFRPVDIKARAKTSKKLLSDNTVIFTLLSQIPWIKMVAVTGSVAAFNADQRSDVDLFIVSTKNRIWLTRFFTVALLKTLGKYRTDGNEAGKICPNLYVDEDHLHWPKNKQNIYIAQEIVMMRPIVNKEDMYFRFIQANKWVGKFNAGFRICTDLKGKVNNRRGQSGTISLVENTMMHLQKAYMKKRQTQEITDNGIIHFNRDDWTDKILKKFDSLIK